MNQGFVHPREFTEPCAVQSDGFQALLNEAAELLVAQSKSSAEAIKVSCQTHDARDREHYSTVSMTYISSRSGWYMVHRCKKKTTNSRMKTNKELDILLMDSLRKIDGEAVGRDRTDRTQMSPFTLQLFSMSRRFQSGIERASVETSETSNRTVPGHPASYP